MRKISRNSLNDGLNDVSDIEQQRKIVADLIFKVIAGSLSVKDALLRYVKDCFDPSVITAYHALCHYDADEDFRAKDETYRTEQDEYLEMIAKVMYEGKPLAQNIIEEYKPYYEDNNPPLFSDNRKGHIKRLLRFLNI